MIEKRLTAEEVAQKRFTPVRLREGYSMDEVDAFLDMVESTLTGQEQELKELQEQLRLGVTAVAAPAEPGVASPDPAVLAELADSKAKIARLEGELAEARSSAASAAAATGGQSLGEAAAASTRMLEMAARQHDDLIAQGQASSKELVENAKKEAERLLAEAAQSRSEILAGLESEKIQLEEAVERLRRLEESSRAALRDHFNQKLEELKGTPVVGKSGGKPSGSSVPKAPNPPKTAGEIADEASPAPLPVAPPTEAPVESSSGEEPPAQAEELTYQAPPSAYPSFFDASQES